jgi:hypothetical protein
MVVIGLAYTLSYAPGAAPRDVQGLDGRLVPVCPAGPCPPGTVDSIGIASDGDDVLVLLSSATPANQPTPSGSASPPTPSSVNPLPSSPENGTLAPSEAAASRASASPTADGTAPTPGASATIRLILTLEDPAQRVVLDRRDSGRDWQVDTGEHTWTAAASRAASLDVLRLPGVAAPARWSATLGGVPAPARGSAALIELPRPRDSVTGNPAGWLAGAVFLSTLVALHAYHSASRRSLRATLRAIGFGALTLFGTPVVVGLARDGAPALPGLLLPVLLLTPLLTLGIAATAATVLTGRAPATGVPPQALRLATALAGVLLLAVLAYTAELTAARYLPGLSW